MATKSRTWDDNFNEAIRSTLFPDARLKELMMIPERDQSILAFITKYFIVDEAGAEALTNEKVRILYYTSESRDFGDHVKTNYLHFDIYTKREEVYTPTKDRLKRRDKLIAQRLRELFLNDTYVHNMRYRFVDEYDLSTKTAGFRRYHLTLSYNTTY